MAKVYVGTSGWNYPSWPGVFYPEDLPSRRFLDFYAREFATVEVNYSFYRLPDPKTFARWVGQVPQDFTFSVKASRFISHIKRLQGVAKAWRTFVGRAKTLGPQLGPVLVQLPPHFPKDTARLTRFLKLAAPSVPRLVFEFRNDSWLTEEVYDLLRRHNTALCVADSVRYQRVDVITADFTYIRFHGRSKMFASNYTKAELVREARKIRRHVDNGVDVYVYFNNDAKGYAVKNARTLIGLLGEREKAGRNAASGLLAK